MKIRMEGPTPWINPNVNLPADKTEHSKFNHKVVQMLECKTLENN